MDGADADGNESRAISTPTVRPRHRSGNANTLPLTPVPVRSSFERSADISLADLTMTQLATFHTDGSMSDVRPRCARNASRPLRSEATTAQQGAGIHSFASLTSHNAMLCGSSVACASRTILITISRLSRRVRSRRERTLTLAPKSSARRVVGFATLGLGEIGITSHGGRDRAYRYVTLCR